MSDKNNSNEPIIAETDMRISIGAGGQLFNGVIISETTPEREVKKKTGVVLVKEKTLFRLAPFTRTTALGFAAAIFAAAEAKNAGDGDKLAEKIFGKYAADASDAGHTINAAGQTVWDEAVYSEALYSVNRRKSGPTLDDQRKSHSTTLEQAVALSDVREEWRNLLTAGLKDGSITVDESGNPSRDPFTAEKWHAVSKALNDQERLAFNLRLDSFAALGTTILAVRDRRVALEKEIAEMETKRAAADAKRKAAKAKKEAEAAAAALAPAPAAPAPAN